MVARLLRRKWSAEQISGTLKKRGTLSISHETIYRRVSAMKRSTVASAGTSEPAATCGDTRGS